MLNKIANSALSKIARNVHRVRVNASEQRSSSMSLVVLVDRDCTSLLPFVRNLRVAAADGCGVDIALVIAADHPHAEQLSADMALSHLRARFFAWADALGLQHAYLDAVRFLKGTWLGHTSVSATFSPRHFPKLRAAIRASKRSTSGFAVPFQLPNLKYKQFDPGLKPGRYVLKNKDWRYPFLDLMNVYVSRQILGGGTLLPVGLDGQLTSAQSLRALREYIDSTGPEITVINGAWKSLDTDALCDEYRPLGTGAEMTASSGWSQCLYEMSELTSVVRADGTVPHWLQVRISLSVSRCLAALETAERALPQKAQERIEEFIGTILQSTSPALWIARRLLPVPLNLRVASISHLAGFEFIHLPVDISYYDPVSELIRIRWIETRPRQVRLRRNLATAAFAYFRSSERHLFGSVKCQEQIGWLPAVGFGQLSFEVDGRESPISIGSKSHKKVTGNHLESLLPALRKCNDSDSRVRLLRRFARSKWTLNRFANAWLFIDKDDKADDNAEHLYRYVTSQPDLRSKCYFILRKSSPDWGRLKQEGFRLIPFGGILHKLALLNAAWLFSSHAAPFVLHLLPIKEFGDMQKFKFCFLQHGVTKDDQSAWLNSRNIELLVTAGQPEFDSMSAAPYKYTAREVALTGFPRYDALLAKKSAEPKTIVIMPTWRKKLVGNLLPGSSQRETNPEFVHSRFFAEWNSVLSNRTICDSLRMRGYRIVFVPHPNITPYLASFDIPEGIEIGNKPGVSMQDYLADCAMLITDYSSIAFDAAYLRRPIVYFQFDEAEFFESHTYSKGYFDYREHGFGPIFTSAECLLAHVEKASSDDFHLENIFRRRIDSFFAYDDAENSRRVVEAVLERSSVHVNTLRDITPQSLKLSSARTPQLSVVRSASA
jgi:CDP-glycerol glycerophosphotransferase (TagB/SpsB family)